ncbi:hypothetical protein HDU97_002919 [Phlyctochytrium planicorne]|nr:hypothetical protein HDU97_002919 [Phlyctochytrium planicorne]
MSLVSTLPFFEELNSRISVTCGRPSASLKSTHPAASAPASTEGSESGSPPKILPVEVWSRIILTASQSVREFATLTSISRSIRQCLWPSSLMKALVVAQVHGHLVHQPVDRKFLVNFPDREDVFLRLLSMKNGGSESELAADERQRFGDQFTLLHLAASGRMYRLAWELVTQFGFDPNLRNNRTRNPTPLLIAADAGDELMVSLLLALGASPNGFNDRNETVLSRAAGKGNLKMVKLLVHGMWPTIDLFEPLKQANLMKLDAQTAIFSIRSRVDEWVEEICNQVTDYDALMDGRLPRDQRYIYKLRRRIWESNQGFQAEDTNDSAEEGLGFAFEGDEELSSTLFAACSSRSIPVIRFILHNGANPNVVQRRWFRWQPIHQVIHSYRSQRGMDEEEGAKGAKEVLECIQMLVNEFGAEVGRRGMDGTAREMAARKKGLEETTRFLEEMESSLSKKLVKK